MFDHSATRRDFVLAAAGSLPLLALAHRPALAEPNSPGPTADEAIHQLEAAAGQRSLKGDFLPPAKTALVIIDMMNLFCDVKWMSGGSAESEDWLRGEFARIIPNLQLALEAFRKAGALVVHVVNAKWTREAREVVPYQRGRDYGLFDTERMSVIEPLKPQEGEILIRKVTSSAFTATGLDFMLRNAGIENVVLAGQYGSACVFYSLIQSREFGFQNYWLDDAILYGGASAKVLFRPLVGAYWARLATTGQIVRAIAGASP